MVMRFEVINNNYDVILLVEVNIKISVRTFRMLTLWYKKDISTNLRMLTLWYKKDISMNIRM